MITVIILTKNESIHIARALESVSSFASKVFVVDSGSEDNTVQLAKDFGADVFYNPFVSQAKQFQWALSNLPIMTPWVMRLDADEVIDSDLADEISYRLPGLDSGVVGVSLSRKHIFMGRWIKYGGRYPLEMIRIWRYGYGKVEDRWMDEHVVVWGGDVIKFNGGFSDWNLNNLTYFISKHNDYATREAIDVILHQLEILPVLGGFDHGYMSRQATLKRWLKNNLYNKLPFIFSSVLYFFWRYFFLLGFLDGKPGFIYHFLQGYWYRFLVGAKLMEFQNALIGISDRHDALEILSRLAGRDLLHGIYSEDLIS